jgi:hypothetical protein
MITEWNGRWVGYRHGIGKFDAIQRGDGSMDIRIWTHDKNDPDPLAYNHVPISQRGVDLIKKLPIGSACAFSLIDPDFERCISQSGRTRS